MLKSAARACALICLGLLVLGACGDESPGLECGPNTYASMGQCLPDPSLCGAGTALDPQSGLCVTTTVCAPGTLLVDEQCVPDGSVICQTGTTYNRQTGGCDPDILGCAEGSVLLGDRCVGEDEARMASQEEAPEPNDTAGLAGTIIAPAVAAQTSVHGCISPTDSDGDGSVDADIDSYQLRAGGPMLLDVTVDGVGGLAGAFVVTAEGGALAAEGWERIGLNLVGDTSRRQIFLPRAGDYLLHIVDSRSLMQDLPVGSATSCYFAGLRGIAMPAAQSIATTASGLLTGNAVFLAYPPESDGEFIRSTLIANSPSAAPALVHMREGLFAGSATGASPVSGVASGLHSGANLIVVVEAHFHYSLDPVPYDYSLSRTSVPAISNGGISTIASGTMPDQELAWFEASAGDVVHIQVDDPNLSMSSVEGDLSAPRNLLCSPCAATDLYFQASRSGIVYLQIESSSAAPSFGAALVLDSALPEPVIVDSPLPVQSLGPQGLRFVSLEEANPSWNVLTASPSGFAGDLELRRYPRTRSGFLDFDIIPQESLLFAGGERVGRIINSSNASRRRQLLRISDTSFDGTADTESFDLSVTSRDVEPLLIGATPIALSSLAIDSPDIHYYLVDAEPGQRVELAVSNLTAADLSIERLANDESSLATINLAGAEGAEVARFFQPKSVDIAIAVRNLGASGSYDLQASLVVPTHSLSGPGAAIALPGTGPIAQTIALATSCIIETLALDIGIVGSNIGDMQVSLVSPQNTTVLLHDLSGGDRDNLLGSYPGTLSPAQSLAVLVGEEAQGDWQLRVQATTFAKSLDSWQLRLYCEP